MKAVHCCRRCCSWSGAARQAGRASDPHLPFCPHCSLLESSNKMQLEEGGASDLNFPPNLRSLFPEPEHPPLQAPISTAWIRPHPPQLYTRFAPPALAWNPCLNNLWFVNAVAAISSQEDVLLNTFVSDDRAEDGLFTFQFFKHGKWHQVAIDSSLPCEPGTDCPQFLRSARTDGLADLWPSLLEKAYAKMRGSYYATEGTGTVEQALMELTGSVASRHAWNAQEAARARRGSAHPLLHQLETWVRRGDVVAALVDTPNAEVGMMPHPAGVLHNHVYVVLDVVRGSRGPGDASVKLFNPWAAGGWNGMSLLEVEEDAASLRSSDAGELAGTRSGMHHQVGGLGGSRPTSSIMAGAGLSMEANGEGRRPV